MLTHKSYLARVEFDDEANLFHGEVSNIRDVITFQGKSVSELRRAFKDWSKIILPIGITRAHTYLKARALIQKMERVAGLTISKAAAIFK